MESKESLVFLSGKRTAFGSNGGSFKEVNPTDLAVCAGKAALEQAQVQPQDIDHVILGNVALSSPDSAYSSRHVGLKLGVPVEIPALGISRLCGSGFQVVVEAYHQMLAGDTRIALVGGVENMSRIPYALWDVRWGSKMGNMSAVDLLTASLFDTFVQAPMAITAENLGAKYNITRAAADGFAYQSQSRYQQALKENRFKDEIAPWVTQDRKGNTVSITQDEHPRADATLEKLAQLKSLFKKDGLVTAGNASGIVDGAAMLVVSTESEAKKRNLKPLGRLVSYGIAGCDPSIMGIGPVPATQIALKRAGLTLQQIDLIEVNEAFAAQALAVAQELEIPQERLNVLGGAIAVGHPLAASGSRLIQTLLYELGRRKKRYGLAAACIGGGQGIAVVIESLVN